MEQWLQGLKESTIDGLTAAHRSTLSVNLPAPFEGSPRAGYGPCPECGARTRSGADKRRPMGLTSNRKGAHCYSEQHGGEPAIDIVDFVSLCLTGKRLKVLSQDEKSDLRSKLANMGLCSPSQGAAESSLRIRRLRPPINQAPPRTEHEPQDDAGEPQVTQAQGAGSRGFKGPLDLYTGCHDDLYTNRDEPHQGHVYGYLEQRGYEEHTIRAWQLGCWFVRGPDGRVVEEWLVIPLKDRDGRIVNYRFRSVPGPCLYCSSPGDAKGKGCPECATKTEPQGSGVVQKRYRPVTGAPLPLFGSHNLSADKAQPVIVLEGELDVIAAWQYGFRESVVTSTAGAGTFKDEWIDLIEPYQSFVLGLDSDKAGDAGATSLAARLGLYRCSRLTLPHKDMADCLQAGVEPEAVQRAVDLIQPMVATKFERADHYAQELEDLILNPDRLLGIKIPLKPLMDALGGVRPGLTIVTGDTSAGKTTFATFIAFMLAQLGVPCLITSFEQTMVGTLQKLMRMQLRGDFTKSTREQRQEAYDALGALPLRIMDRAGQIKASDVIDNIRYAKRRFGTQFFLVDHLGYLTAADAENELKAINKVIRDLSDLSKEEQVTIWLICHPSNSNKIERRRVNMSDLKGSSSIRQDAHEVLVVERGMVTKARQFTHAMVYIDKCRSEFGGNGAEVLLAFDPIALIYTATPEESPTRQGGGQICSTSSVSVRPPPRRPKKEPAT